MARLSRKFLRCFTSEYLWKSLVMNLLGRSVKSVGDKEEEESWRNFYQRITEWKWDTQRKAEELIVSKDGRNVSRPTTDGSNPAILTTLPFSKSREFYEVIVDNLGDWVSIGVADSKLKVDGGGVLGRSFFFQGASKLQTPGINVTEIKEKRIPDLKKGDRVGVYVNYEKGTLSFYLNGLLLSKLELKESGVYKSDGEWFPAAGISYMTSITFTSRYRPYLEQF